MPENVYHQFFFDYLGLFLTPDDAPGLWECAVNAVFHDAHYLIDNRCDKRVLTTTIGVCSHWQRPNQTRWTADGGFACPSGYSGHPYDRLALPGYDWYFIWCWEPSTARWVIADPHDRSFFKGRKMAKRLNLEVILPTRTARHQQAVVHTRWTPGSPILPGNELREFYGFRRDAKGEWSLRATKEFLQRKSHYEKAAENEAQTREDMKQEDIRYWQREYERAIFSGE